MTNAIKELVAPPREPDLLLALIHGSAVIAAGTCIGLIIGYVIQYGK